MAKKTENQNKRSRKETIDYGVTKEQFFAVTSGVCYDTEYIKKEEKVR